MAWHTTWNDPPQRRSGWLVDRGGFFPPGVKLVLIVTVGVYFLDVFTAGALTKWGGLSVRHLMHLQVWRLFTYMFLHSLGGIDHILWNMFIFVMLGATLERQLGARQFLWLYVGCGVVGGVCEVAFNLAMHFEYGGFMTRGGPMTFLDIPAVGASAGVAGVLVAFAVINPRAVFLLFFILPIQARWLAIVYGVIETRHIVLGLRTGWIDGVAHAAHFGGMALGFIWMKWGARIVAALGQRARRTRPHSIGRSRTDEQAEVDRILDKIHQSGIDSLTTREKLFLQEMGGKYRDR
ncbi:MAG TPA: rhomboid family intramembrane serine protease [Phycisphaerae bacterium]|nr:rhomboid family intramembrane serine protease [Phycisphaerae bacterium]